MPLSRSWQAFLLFALFANYLSAFTMSHIWKNQIAYYLITFTVSLFAGIILKDFSRVIVAVGTSFVISTVISILVTLSPLLIYGAPYEQLDVGVILSTKDAMVLLIMTLPLCIIVGMIGCFIADFVSRP